MNAATSRRIAAIHFATNNQVCKEESQDQKQERQGMSAWSAVAAKEC